MTSATATETETVNIGLDGVVVATTILSEVDGEAGRLVVRGHRIEELTGRISFETMAGLLWEDLAPTAHSGAGLQRALGEARVAAFERVAALLGAAAGKSAQPALPALPADPAKPATSESPALSALPALPALPAISALRLGLSSLRPTPAVPAHILATAAVPVFVSAFARQRRGLQPVPPDPALGQAADFLRMLRGEPAGAGEVAALDAYLVTVAEHGMNASTFTARVVASTRAGVLPAVIAALCALEGPLHGGAPGPVLDMLDALAGPEADAGAWIAAELAAGRRLMGFGHRIYRVRDPRADVLKAQVARLRHAESTGGEMLRTGASAPEGAAEVVEVAERQTGRGAEPEGGARPDTGGHSLASRLALAERVEREALAALAILHPDRRLDTNVEFYTAVLLDALGIDRELFTSVFAAGRVAGWTAHVFEQERLGRLIRPQSAYVGPRPGTPKD